MKKSGLISVIIPAYNEEKRIKKCIDSVINQTYKNLEIIIINDGSTDNTLDVLNKINDKRLNIITIKNHGQGHARNLGIEKSTGDLITFVDSDDYIAEDMIEKLYNNMQKNNSDISICNILKILGNSKIKFDNYNSFFNNNNINYMISHPGPVGRLYKKSLFIDNNIYFLEDSIYEDLATIPLVGIYAKKISNIEDYLYYYIIRANSSMNQIKYSKKLEDIFKVMDHLKIEFSKVGDTYFEVLEYLNIEHLLYSAYLRFIEFKEGKDKCIYISNYIKDNYPNWNKNKIYKQKSKKFQLFCFFASHKLLFICKLMKKVGKK